MTPIFANVLQPLVDVFESILVFFHDTGGFGWGFSIIAMTLVVRAALVPLTLKQTRSMQRLQAFTPQIKALQEKYKDDKQRLNQEMMKFYQENKVNPLSSCLPIVAQLPVFISLFYMLRKDLKLDICGEQLKAAGVKNITNTACDTVAHGSAKFLFIPDLTAAATGSVLVVLIVLYVASQLGSSVLMSTTADKNQRRLMIALPLIFVTFIIRFPAGLIVYWITTNLWTVGQTVLVRRTVGPVAPATVPAGAADAVKPAKAVAPASGRNGGSSGDKQAAPPPPPRRKKKRSGRRR